MAVSTVTITDITDNTVPSFFLFVLVWTINPTINRIKASIITKIEITSPIAAHTYIDTPIRVHINISNTMFLHLPPLII